MAYVGPWGCFVHVPKTGGQWVRTVLRTTIRNGNEDGPSHSFPKEFDMRGNVFSFVRRPDTWYRSFWGHRIRDSFVSDQPGHFRANTNDSEAWNTLLYITLPYMSTNFDEFVDNVTTHIPGIYTWFIGFYYSPVVNMMPFEYQAYSYLHQLGAKPFEVAAVNQGISRMEPVIELWPEVISDESREKIEASEERIYRKWYSSSD